MNLWDRFKTLYARRGVKVAVWAVLILLLVGGVFRFCTGTPILGAKTYYIGRNSIWPPLDLLGKEPYVTAFTTDLMTDIANRKKLKIVFLTEDDPNIFDSLNSGNFDAILADVLPNSYMREHYNLSDPLMLTGPVLIVQSSSQVTSLEQLNNKGGLGIRRGSPSIFKISQDINLTLVPFDNISEALDDLVNGSLIGVVIENPLAHILLRGLFKDKLKIATPPLTEEGIRLITHWNHDGEYLVEQFNEGLKELRADGTFEKLIEKWTLFAQ